MSDVFISYSRRDAEFAQRLSNAFVAVNRVVWIDWQSIPRGEDWWREIEIGIEGADSFICVISEHWLTSEICHKELLHARHNHKRVLPLIRQPIRDAVEKQVKGTWMDTAWEQTARENWDFIRHLNWVFFDDDSKFESEFQALLTTLDEDQPHVKAHTRYQNRALEWERSGRNPSFLIAGDDLDFAETWLRDGKDKLPAPTDLQRAYITDSRRAEDARLTIEANREQRIRQFRLAAAGLMTIGISAAIIAVVSFGQANNAALREATANAQVTEAFGALATTTIVLEQAQIEQAVAIAQANSAGTREADALRQADMINASATPAAATLAVASTQIAAVPPTLTRVAQDIQIGQNRIESLRLAAEAAEAAEAGDMEIAALLSIRALNTAHNLQADSTLGWAVNQLDTQQRFVGHTGEVDSVAFSPNGRFVLTGSVYGPARLWDAKTGEELHQFAEHTTSVEFSPDGQFVLTGTQDGIARLWNSSTGRELRQFLGHTDPVTSVAFSPDGQFVLTGTQDGIVRLWDAKSGAELREFVGHNSAVDSVTFSPDGRFILTIVNIDNTARLWDAITGEELRQFAHFSYFSSAAFSPDGRFLLIVDERDTTSLWDASTGEVLYQFAGTGVAFSPDSRFVLTQGSNDNSVRLWDTNTGEELRQFIGHTRDVRIMLFSPDGRFVFTSGNDGTARLWDASSGEELRAFTPYYGIRSAAFSPDGRLILTGSSDGTVHLWDTNIEAELRKFTGHTHAVNSVAFSPDGRFVVTSGPYEGIARLWDANTRRELRQLIANVDSVAFSPDGRFLLTGNIDGTASLWDVSTGKELRQFVVPYTGLDFEGVNSVAFSPDGHFILAGGWGGIVSLWDAGTGQELRRLTGHTNDVNSVMFSPDGRLALSGSWDGTARLWDISSGEELRQFIGYTDGLNIWASNPGVTSAALSPDGHFVLTGSGDGAAHLWDISTGEELREFSGLMPRAINLIANPDKPVQTSRTTVNSVVFSPDGRFALTGSADTTARMWDVNTGEELRQFVGHTAAVTSVAFSPDGRFVLTGSEDGTARLWDTEYHDFITYACTRVIRDFTPEERLFYKLDDAPTCPQFGDWAQQQPTSTPIATASIPVWTPIASPTASITPTFTPTRTPTPTSTSTATPLPVRAASLGVNIGELPLAGGQRWSYAGRTGEVLTISVHADLPANDAQDRTGLLDTLLTVRAPDGRVLAEADDIDAGVITDSVIENLTLPEDGVFEIEVRSWDNRSGGGYTLIIEQVDEMTLPGRSSTPTAISTRNLVPPETPTPS